MMSVKQESRYVCGSCGKSFMRLAAKENHERLTHSADKELIRASCLERRVPTKRGEGKKGTRKEDKGKGGQKKSQSLPEQGSSSACQHPVPSTDEFCQDVRQALDENSNESESMIRENRVEHIKQPQRTGIDSSIATCKEYSDVKIVNISYNSRNSAYYCFECKAKIERVESLFNHRCLEPRGSGSLCKLCGCIMPECLCQHHLYKVVVEGKGLACTKGGKSFGNENAQSDHDCTSKRKQHTALRDKKYVIGNSREVSVWDASGKSTNRLSSKVSEKMSNAYVKCPHCKKLFKNDLYLNNHLLSHSELQKFDCFFCRLFFSTGAKLKDHLKTVHGHQPEDSCNRTGDIVQTESGLRYRCSLCPKIFACKSNRRRHERWHFGIRPHSCDLCGAAFRQRWQLNTHKKTKRCKENTIRTKIAMGRLGHISSTQSPGNDNPDGQQAELVKDGEIGELEDGEIIEGISDENIHVSHSAHSIHGSRANASPTPASQPTIPERATIPTSSLSSSASYNPSSNMVHLDQTFQNPSVQQEETPLDLTRVTKVRRQPMFVCQDCGKVCKTNRNLVIHKRIHTGERPYSCTMCSLTFRQSHHRKAHMLSRHGVYHPLSKQPTKQEIVVVTENGIRYKCHHCSKVLMSRSGRRKHERWHLGLRPHRCNNCGNMFKQLQHLKKHQMSSKCKSSQLRLIAPKEKKEPEHNVHGRVGPLTSWHMMKVLADSHHKKQARDLNDNLSVSQLRASQSMDMPSALGLVSTHLLKARNENLHNADGSGKKDMPLLACDEQVDYDGILSAGDEMQNEGLLSFDGNMNEADQTTDQMKSIKEEVLSEIEEGEVVDMDDIMSDGGDCESNEVHPGKRRWKNTDMNNGDQIPLNLSSSRIPVNNQDKNQVQCPICGQHYKSRQNLGVHMRIHTGERPHSCSICHKKFIQPHHLKAHLKSKHNIIMVTPTKPVRQEEIIMTQEGIRFKCQYCPKLLTSKNGRQKHERWHLGLRPHKCDVCGKAFKQSHHLKRHKAGTACIPPGSQEQNKEKSTSPPSKHPSPISLPDVQEKSQVQNGTPHSKHPNTVSFPQKLSASSGPIAVLVPASMLDAQHLPKKALNVMSTVAGYLVPQQGSGFIKVLRARPKPAAPEDTKTEDPAPEDLSMRSSKLIDLHCYE